MNPFLNAGAGTALQRVAASTGNVPTEPRTTTIPAGGYSETFAAHEGDDVKLLAIYAAAASGNLTIEQVIDKAASVAGETFAQEAVTTSRFGRFSAGEPLTGYFRVKNDADQSATVYYNNARKGA